MKMTNFIKLSMAVTAGIAVTSLAALGLHAEDKPKKVTRHPDPRQVAQEIIREAAKRESQQLARDTVKAATRESSQTSASSAASSGAGSCAPCH